MNYYINCITDFTSLERGVKELITDMNIRRRISPLVKTAVCTGIETLIKYETAGGSKVDAIITSTGLGCIADSEKFLDKLIDSKEEMLNPTPFIQSTFNTVGAQIALIRSLKSYNNTFTHRYTSFESALIDAILRLKLNEAESVLIGAFDEATPTVEKLMQRMGLLKNKQLGHGAYFFVLTNKKLSTSVCEIKEISFSPTRNKELLSSQESAATCEDSKYSYKTQILELDNKQGETILLSAENNMHWSGAMVQTIFDAINKKRSCRIINDLGGKFNSFITIQCF